MKSEFVFMEEAGAGDGAGSAGGSPGLEPSSPSAAGDTVVDPGSSQSGDWRSSLPLELRDSPTLKDIPDLNTLVKNYEHTKAMVGASIRLPTAEAGQEDIAAIQQKLLESEHLGLMKKPDIESAESMAEVYKALGRPEDASGYAVPEDINGELFGSMADTALNLGLSKAQYEGMAKALGDQQLAQFQQMEASKTEAVGQLKGEWGPAYEQKMGRAVQIAEALKAPQALVDALKDGSANAEAIRFMDTVATQLGQEGSQVASQLGQVTESTVSDIKARISDRTKRMLNEPMPPSEYKDLMDRNVKDHELLSQHRG